MSAHRPANHPVNVSGVFQATSDSELKVIRGNQYGLITTGSFFQCAGIGKDKELDFEVKLMANTAITNALDEGVFYSLSGRMIAMNDGALRSLPIIRMRCCAWVKRRRHRLTSPIARPPPVLDSSKSDAKSKQTMVMASRNSKSLSLTTTGTPT
ncbi:hypothetical protein Pst134EB_030948 [Puccinia striiformis f. sp. tritici]|nr:hypothetical protein Pst134EB_030948 [Puccinia striiformis f. sp. tritici]